MWEELGVAIALLLVLEGIIPFISPQMMRRMLEAMLEVDDRTMRITGLVSMVSGVVLLYWVR